jgi:hypothetical protein
MKVDHAIGDGYPTKNWREWTFKPPQFFHFQISSRIETRSGEILVHFSSGLALRNAPLLFWRFKKLLFEFVSPMGRSF